MKPNIFQWLWLVIFTGMTMAAEPAAEMKSLLQQGLYEEDAAQQLDKAAESYEKLLASFDAQRPMAATALFRLAEVRRKQGKKEDAVKLYVRFLTDFPNHNPLARLSRENLAALGAADAAPAAGGDGESEEDKDIRELEKLAKESPDLMLFKPSPNGGAKVNRLEQAAAEGKLKLVAFLLEHGAKLKGSQALHRAAGEGRRAMCELLLSKGAELNPSEDAQPPLLLAIQKDQPNLAQFLLEKGANPNLPAKGKRPLTLALSWRQSALAKVLVEKGADVNFIDDTGTGGPDGDVPRGLIGNALHGALYEKDWAMANFLLDHKADVNIAMPDHGVTPLHLVAAEGGVELTKRLLELGAKVDAKTSESKQQPGTLPGGKTPLYYAIDKDQLEIAKLLVAAGAKFDTDEGLTELAAGKSVGFLELVLASGLPMNWRNKDGTTLISLAVRLKSKELLSKFLEAKPSEEELNLALGEAFAVMKKPEDQAVADQMVELLIAKGADPAATMENRMSPLARRSLAVEQKKLSEKYLYPKLAGRNEVNVTLPLGGKFWRLTEQKDGNQPPALAELLTDFKYDDLKARFWGGSYDWEKGVDGKINFEHLRLLRRNKETGVWTDQEIDLLGKNDFPTLQWGDVLEVEIPLVDSHPNFSGYYINGVREMVALSDTIRSALRRQMRQTITVRMDGVPEKFTLSGKLAIYDPTQTTVPFGNAQQLFEMLGGKHPKFNGSTLRVKRQGAEDLYGIEGTPNAAFQLKDGDVFEVVPQPEMDVTKVVSKPDSKADGTAADKVMPEELSQVYRRQITLVSPGLPFAYSLPVASNPTLLQLIASEYQPLVTQLANGVGVEEYWAKLFPYERPFGTVLPHPDFSKIRIVRHFGEPSVVEVDLAKAIANCTEKTTPSEARALDLELLPGDVVELPVIQEKLAEEWKGFDAATAMFLRKAMTYRVSVAYSGKTLPLTYEYTVPSFLTTDAGLVIYHNSEQPWQGPTMDGVFAQVAGPNQRIGQGSLTRKGGKAPTSGDKVDENDAGGVTIHNETGPLNPFRFLRDQDFLNVEKTSSGNYAQPAIIPAQPALNGMVPTPAPNRGVRRRVTLPGGPSTTPSIIPPPPNF